MAFVDTISQQRARGLAVSALGLSLALVLLSRLDVTVFGTRIALSFLPFTAVYFWPRLADPLISVLGIFVLGLITDFLTSSPAGLWAFVYLIYFMVFRPDRQESATGLFSLWIGFLAAVIFATVIIIGVSLLFAGRRPNLLSLLWYWVPVVIIFPLSYLMYRAVGRRSTDGSGAGFVT